MRQLLGYRFRRTTLWLLACLSALAGVALARTGMDLSRPWVWLAAIPLVWSIRRRSWLALVCIVIVCGGFGLQRGAVYMQRLDSYQPLYSHKVTLLVTAAEDGVYGTNSQLSFTADRNVVDGKSLVGKIQVSGFGLNAVFQGDQVLVTGKLYSAYGAYQGRISYAQLSLVSHHPSTINDLRRRFAAGMQSALPEPLAPFAMGLLIGQRATLPADVKQDLLMVGLTHIIAVSGYNLTIILGASNRAMGKYSKRLATLVAFMLMAVFLLLAGTSASIVRAAIVSTLSIATGYYGRSFKPLNLICIAAAITALANPLYLWGDASWWLSFLAFFGVLVLAPLVVQRLWVSWRHSIILMVAIESLCAETMTLPFVLHTFGQMSLIGLPANVLVVTLIPLAMLLSLIAGLAGMLASNFAGWLAWPARLLLTYMLDVAHLLAHVPRIFLQQLAFPATQMLAAYVLVGLLVTALWIKTNRHKRAKITEKKVMKSEELAT